MSRFELKERFALIFIAFRSFQILLTPEDQRRCLQCVRHHLAPNGRVIINLFDPRYDMILPGRQESLTAPREFIHPVSGNRVVVETLERVCEPVSQTFEERWRFTESDSSGAVVRSEEEFLRLRWTFRYEMRHLVERCGFVIEAEYSDFHRSPPAYAKETGLDLESGVGLPGVATGGSWVRFPPLQFLFQGSESGCDRTPDS